MTASYSEVYDLNLRAKESDQCFSLFPSYLLHRYRTVCIKKSSYLTNFSPVVHTPYIRTITCQSKFVHVLMGEA